MIGRSNFWSILTHRFSFLVIFFSLLFLIVFVLFQSSLDCTHFHSWVTRRAIRDQSFSEGTKLSFGEASNQKAALCFLTLESRRRWSAQAPGAERAFWGVLGKE